MIVNIYGIYDKRLGRYFSTPLAVRDDAEAIATVVRSLPEKVLPDAQLEKLGTFDDKTAEIVVCNKEIIPLEVQNG